MPRSSSSKRWLKEHFTDPYVKQAQIEGYPSRAVYKLLEIQQKDQLIKPGMTIVDLGAAPGGWSMAAAQLVGEQGQVIALDILPIDSIAGVKFIQGDFTEQAVLDELLTTLQGRTVEVVLSDMAPNLSGNKTIDQPRIMYLAELALDFALQVLTPGGSFLVKVFQGTDFDTFLQQMKKVFQTVHARKPTSSRSRSNEIYLVGKRKKI